MVAIVEVRVWVAAFSWCMSRMLSIEPLNVIIIFFVCNMVRIFLIVSLVLDAGCRLTLNMLVESSNERAFRLVFWKLLVALTDWKGSSCDARIWFTWLNHRLCGLFIALLNIVLGLDSWNISDSYTLHLSLRVKPTNYLVDAVLFDIFHGAMPILWLDLKLFLWLRLRIEQRCNFLRRLLLILDNFLASFQVVKVALGCLCHLWLTLLSKSILCQCWL